MKLAPDKEVIQSSRYSETLLDFKGKSLREEDGQLRVLSKLKDIENLDRINVQGIAGSGKTILLYNAIEQLINTLPKAKFTWLSNSLHLIAQVECKYAGVENLSASTHLNFLEQLIPPRSLWGARYMTLTKDQYLIDTSGVKAGTGAEVNQDLKNVRYTVDNFCRANVMSFKDFMVPNFVGISGGVQKRSIILEYAKHYWKLITNYRTPEPRIGVSRLHHIKWLQTHTQKIPKLKLDFLVIDECQDVYPAALYLIKCLTGQYAMCKERQTQAIMFGDRYQTTSQHFNDWGYEWKKAFTDPALKSRPMSSIPVNAKVQYILNQ